MAKFLNINYEIKSKIIPTLKFNEYKLKVSNDIYFTIEIKQGTESFADYIIYDYEHDSENPILIAETIPS